MRQILADCSSSVAAHQFRLMIFKGDECFCWNRNSFIKTGWEIMRNNLPSFNWLRHFFGHFLEVLLFARIIFIFDFLNLLFLKHWIQFSLFMFAELWLTYDATWWWWWRDAPASCYGNNLRKRFRCPPEKQGFFFPATTHLMPTVSHV